MGSLPPRGGGGQQSRTNSTGHLQYNADLPRRNMWPVCEQLAGGGCALDECPISWGDAGQSSQALGGKGEERWAEQIRVWKFGVNREFRSLTGHWSLSVKKSHLSAR